ncbi:MAG: hypothetical protein AAB209_11520, partial [Bacteroidota bacterium]
MAPRIISIALLRLTTTLVLYCGVTRAQTPDPLNFFPYSTGNMWEYFWVEPGYPGTLQSFMFRDSVGTDGRIYVTKRSRFINPIVPVQEWPRRVSIDTTLKQVWGDLGYGFGILYKLNALQGDKWVISTRG